jgi:hypothetical protein
MKKKGVVFNNTNYPLSNLIEMVDAGTIALPDIQRPFVWQTIKVRDLMDSLYKGLPAGLVILWNISKPGEFKPIGINKPTTPNLLVIDGQQRLTSLFSVIKGKSIIDKNFNQTKLRIAFNPLEERFEVSNPAIEKDVEWISDIHQIFATNAYDSIDHYIAKFKNKKPDVFLDDKKIKENIGRVASILDYPFSALELSSDLDPEEVSEIFVRINSQGKPLNQSDFILTIMSVYWDEGRRELEDFSKASAIPSSGKASPYNFINIKPRPEDLLRTIVGYSFLRGRLKYAYLILKGRNLENQTTSEDERNKNFNIFKEGQKIAVDLTNWHDFIKTVYTTGFINEYLIGSKTAFYATYALYLIGKFKSKVQYKELESVISKWIIFSLLTRRYTSSPESAIEQDLVLFRKDRDFVLTLERIMDSELTKDFWEVTLPQRMVSSSTANTAYKVHQASLINKDVKVPFSQVRMKDCLNPLFNVKKKILENHHIFPKNYLINIGIKDLKDYNQIANLIYIEYKDNINISDTAPFEYWPEMIQSLSENDKKDLEENYVERYDLPEKFWTLDYNQFLEERRKLMAKSIKKYFESLKM